MLRFAPRFAVLGLTLSLAALPAIAQYPERPIRRWCPMRLAGNRQYRSAVGRETRRPSDSARRRREQGGANGIIGSDAVAKSPADGYTLLLAGLGPLAVNPSLFQKMPYEPARAFAPIVKVSSAALVLVVPGVSKDGLKEIVAGAKSKPGELNIANAGEGSPQHICAELFARSAGIRVNHIPYKGAAPAVTDLLGSVQALCDNVGTVRAFVQSGKVKALAVSTRQRAQALPDVPTFEEQGLAGVDFSLWFMLVAPAGTPEEVVTRLNTEINAILKQPDVIRTLQDNGSEAAGGSVAEASEFGEGKPCWPELVRSIGLTRQ